MPETAAELQETLSAALRDGDAEVAEVLTRQVLAGGADPLGLVQDVFVPALTEVGQRFQDGEVYLPELMMAGEAARRATAIIEAATVKAGQALVNRGTVVLGTVEGDAHDIGKNIVNALLTAHGFKVVDLGRDVKPSRFLAAAEESGCDIVALSALMTTTLPAARRTISVFDETGARANHRLVVGGGAVSKEWADAAGADGYAADAAAAVELCKSLVGKEQRA
jgi:5-methyltetrahydrofolate--homocysteine methyltransferase